MGQDTETTAATFAGYQRSFAGQLRYQLAQSNLLAMHDLSAPIDILDAASGNGLNSDWLLQRGHRLTLIDADANMLRAAEERLRQSHAPQRYRCLHARLEDADELFAADAFGLVVCHHILEYVADPAKALAALFAVTAPEGELSLVTLNPVSEVLRAALFQKDPVLAHAKLEDTAYDAKWFGNATLYAWEQIVEWCHACGWKLQSFRGIRVLADYLPEGVRNAEREAAVFRLEDALGALEPYRRIGRYLQFSFKKMP